MAVTITDNMTLVDAADSTTGWTIGSNKNAAVNASPRESTLCIGYQAATNEFNEFFHVITAVNFTNTTLFVPWMRSGGPGTTTQGGFCGIIGDSSGNTVAYHLGGVEAFGPQVRGFTRFRLDSAVLPATTTTVSGTPASLSLTSVTDLGGGIYSTIAPSGQAYNNWFDICRYIANGSAALTITGGTTGDRGTFAEIVTEDESTSNAWGVIFSKVAGGKVYELLFGITIGDTTAATDSYFDDSDFQLFLNGTDMSAGNLDMEIVGGTGTNLFHIDSFSIASVGTAGAWNFTNDVDDLSVTNGSFIDSGNITFPTNAGTTRVATSNIFTGCGTISFGTMTATGCTFTNCGQVTAGSGDLSDSSWSGFEGTAGTAALIFNETTDPDGELDNASFTKGTAATHAIELGANTPTSITLRDWTVSGYNASNGQNDSVIYNNSNKDITVNVVGNSGTISYRNGGTSTTTIVVNPVTLTVTTKKLSDQSALGSTRVLALPADGTGPLPFQESVTITQTGGTASVSHTGHGLSSGDKVLIEGVTNEDDYNGVKTISNVTTNAYDYSCDSGNVSPAVGTILSTAVIIDGESNATTGIVSDTRSYSSDQPITGRARKSSADPYYRTAPITGTIDASNGLSVDVLLAEDQ